VLLAVARNVWAIGKIGRSDGHGVQKIILTYVNLSASNELADAVSGGSQAAYFADARVGDTGASRLPLVLRHCPDVADYGKQYLGALR
jgi:hypothetical protein